MELPDEIYEQITELGERGNDYAEAGAFDQGIDAYQQAWELLPAPKHSWQAATWILTAIGDFRFFVRDYSAARQALTEAMKCPEGLGNPFVHLRLGQVEFELGNQERATEELGRAFALEGATIFEDEDPKYLAFVKGGTKRRVTPGSDTNGSVH